VRRDLPIGTLAAQLIHAAGVSAAAGPGALPPDSRAIALMVDGEAELALLAERLELAAVPHVAIREPDPPWSGALMAIGISPFVDPRAARRVLARLPLLR
jgi:hypothetical protein